MSNRKDWEQEIVDLSNYVRLTKADFDKLAIGEAVVKLKEARLILTLDELRKGKEE